MNLFLYYTFHMSLCFMNLRQSRTKDRIILVHFQVKELSLNNIFSHFSFKINIKNKFNVKDKITIVLKNYDIKA
jgi:hypothetical protein